MPVPDNAKLCGLPAALSVTESVPVTGPVVPGTKVTRIMQFAPELRVEPQVLVSPKLALAAPMLTMLSVPVPELLSVMSCAGLLVPTASLPKFKLVADKVALGDPPVDPPPQPLIRNKAQSLSERHFFIPVRSGARRRSKVAITVLTPSRNKPAIPICPPR